jgi:hypothetical protein
MGKPVKGHDYAAATGPARAVEDGASELRMLEQAHGTGDDEPLEWSQEWPALGFHEVELRSLRKALEKEWLDDE